MRTTLALVVLSLLGSCATEEEEAGPSGIELLPARQQLLRLSVDLRGVHPSEAELAAVEADPRLYDLYVDAWLDDTPDDAAARLELIRSSHVDSRGWADIGYHLIVDPQGRIWQGRPMNLQGAHVKDHNPHNLGVLVMGNFEEQHPTREALATLDQLLANQAAVHRVPFGSIRTHQEWASTACPGRNLQAYMNATRSKSGRLRSMMLNG